jgi:hypothetical protein
MEYREQPCMSVKIVILISMYLTMLVAFITECNVLLRLLYAQNMLLAGCSESLIPLSRFLDIVKDFVVEPGEFKTLCSDIRSDTSKHVVPPAKFD